MTATQVMETLQKEGVLIAPFAARRETEKLGPQIERELDIMMREGDPDDSRRKFSRPARSRLFK
jgi:hypothetical protein